MTIDLLVKISQIITPLILALAGYLISKNLNKQAYHIRLSSNFNTKWADVLIRKCINFSNLVTKIVVGLQKLSEENYPSTAAQKEVNIQINDLRESEYDVQIHIELVENTEEIKETVSEIFSKLGLILKNKHGSIDDIKALQSTLNKQLRDLHKNTIGL